MIDPRTPTAMLLAAILTPDRGIPCRCDDDAARECSGGGLPRTTHGACSCRCHGAETMPAPGEGDG